VFKAADFCAAEPASAAQQLVDAGFTERYDYALQTLTEVPYASWREFDPADSMRFYAVRLHEVDMVKSSPTKILAQGTDWPRAEGAWSGLIFVRSYHCDPHGV
jgi:NitT/TauT family transport system substrate-binding protein